MPVFEYKARDRSGKLISSTIEAENIAQVRDGLRSRGMFIVDIKPPKTGLQQDIKIPGLGGDGKPGLKTVAIFSRQMATMLNSGVPLVQSLAIMQRQSDHKGMQKIIHAMRTDVEAGQPFSEAIAKHPKVFSRLYLNLVRAGEVSGTLDSVLDRISNFLEKDLALRGKIKSAMTYPVIVLVFALGITYFLMTTIVPQFANILTQLGAELPLLTRGLMTVSDFLQHQTIFIALIVAALVFAYRAYYRTPKGRRVVDAIKLKIPVFGTLLQRTAIASFARTFGLLLSSGVNIVESLEITRGTANNAVVEDTLNNSKTAVMGGDLMSNTLASSNIFPPMVVSMIAIGEETGALDAMLGKIADFYDREVEEAVDSLTAAIEPLMIVFLGAIVGLIVAGMFLPMFSVIGQLSQ
ncbi:type IV pilus assembly protein PilC [Deinobacterium chartae]|uniref:Type IV pilus assembly protein PilC n=1 Tax=Deinobacterium chartae TaxID=521158 RepID=A0A841HUA0_9DEIO|nr:type II secretion system F family protein [Deinobacterium chartae]MBB6097011.1 type IV pilus assembly protein PilC [Deinobacterium chartae]